MLSSLKGELKAKGVEEAARDPESNVTAQDAQKVIIEESKKAGATALHFDPNASPEEKAAQAKSRQNDTLHHKPKGVGIVSDLNTDGKDDYDLPPPSAKGVITTVNGSAEPGAPEGVPPQEDEWKKVGWAPRFGSGETDSIKDEPSLLDHQTWLEGKLDHKFYGDWYHNTAIIIVACLLSWITAILGGGLGWLFLVMAGCGTYYRTSIRRVRRNFRDDVTRELAKAKLDSDNESLEWMNSFLVKFWPIYAPQLAKSIVQSVDQVLSTSTPAFLDSMRMETFILGTKPPRMEHVKTYPRLEDDIVQMDWKFSFTPTDTLDMTARQLKYKINPRVVLEIRLGKGLVSKAMKIIVEDFAFSGLIRIKMKLQLEFPHIEKVDMCFLERPEIDYVCKPLGGDTFGFDINFIPGLETFIKEQIHANLEPIMYAPNVFPIEVAKMLSGNPIDLAIGVVAITIHGANGLKNPDKFSGTPDPYVMVSLNSRVELGRTKTVHENANPRWNETVYVIVTNYTDALTLQIFDYNEIRKDKELGVATFPLDKLEQVADHENMQLEVLAGGKPRGVVQCDVRFFPVLEAGKAADGSQLPPPESNTGIARITIEQAKDLDGTKSLVGSLNPYGVLLLNGKEVHITGKLKRTNNPIFPNPSTSVLVTDRKKARIGLMIKDDRDIASDPEIGSYQIKLDDILHLMQKGQEWFHLARSKTGRAKLTVDWKPVALKGTTGSGGYITPVGVMRVHFQSASDLRNFETLGKSDPYARVQLSGVDKGRTVTWRNNLNPAWDEVIYVPVHSANERLVIEVMDEEKLGKDRSLGLIEVPLTEYIREVEDGSYPASARKELVDDLRLHGRGAGKGKLKYSLTFYPTLDVVDPDDEEEEAEEKAAEAELNGALLDVPRTPTTPSRAESIRSKKSLEGSRPTDSRKSLESAGRFGAPQRASISGSTNGSILEQKQRPKLRLTAEELSKYESGLIVFNILEGDFHHNNCRLEVLIDDQLYPSYVSSSARAKKHKFGEVGDAFVRELEYSRITLRLVEKQRKNSDDEEDHILGKLVGQTIQTLQQCLYQRTELRLKDEQSNVSTVFVKLKYLPVAMQLDPSESINNSGTLRVEVLDADDLPSADRNGYSDPYCKFKLGDKEVYKTKVQKKTLHPAWNEFFETPITSRTASHFRCDIYDWDLAGEPDYLGGTDINLSILEPFHPQEITLHLDGKSGVLRLKMLFKSSYVTRARQGSSTMSGTFAVPGKVVGAPVKGVAKVGGAVGGGVLKGASFLKRGLTGRQSKEETTQAKNTDKGSTPLTPSRKSTIGEPSASPAGTSTTAATSATGSAAMAVPTTPKSNRLSRAGSTHGTPVGEGGADTGTANLTIVSAAEYPADADVRVYVKMVSSKGAKEVFKTKAIKSSNGTVEFDTHHETFKVQCAADTQFQIVVKDHGTFSSKDLGEALFFISDQGSGGEQTVKAGQGTVTLQSSFTPKSAQNGYAESLRPTTSGGEKEGRRSFFGRRKDEE